MATKCTTCGGSGKEEVTIPCYKCGGAKYIKEYGPGLQQADWNPMRGSDSKVCPVCNGRGSRSDRITCRVCSGKGYLGG